MLSIGETESRRGFPLDLRERATHADNAQRSALHEHCARSGCAHRWLILRTGLAVIANGRRGEKTTFQRIIPRFVASSGSACCVLGESARLSEGVRLGPHRGCYSLCFSQRKYEHLSVEDGHGHTCNRPAPTQSMWPTLLTTHRSGPLSLSPNATVPARSVSHCWPFSPYTPSLLPFVLLSIRGQSRCTEHSRCCAASGRH